MKLYKKVMQTVNSFLFILQVEKTVGAHTQIGKVGYFLVFGVQFLEKKCGLLCSVNNFLLTTTSVIFLFSINIILIVCS